MHKPYVRASNIVNLIAFLRKVYLNILIKIGLYRIRLVRIICRSTPVVMLSPAVAMAADVHGAPADGRCH